jgi:hypothetical protein
MKRKVSCEELRKPVEEPHPQVRCTCQIESSSVDSPELHRFVLLVFKQDGIVSTRHVVEHSMDEKSHRSASLAKFIHMHSQIQPAAWAGTFFVVDCQPDEAYVASKHVEDMFKSVAILMRVVKLVQRQAFPLTEV